MIRGQAEGRSQAARRFRTSAASDNRATVVRIKLLGSGKNEVQTEAGSGEDVEERPVDIGESHGLAETVTSGQDDKWRAQQELNLQPLVP